MAIFPLHILALATLGNRSKLGSDFINPKKRACEHPKSFHVLEVKGRLKPKAKVELTSKIKDKGSDDSTKEKDIQSKKQPEEKQTIKTQKKQRTKASTSIPTSTASSQPLVKRGRGRPKKVPDVTVAATTETHDNTISKNKTKVVPEHKVANTDERREEMSPKNNKKLKALAGTKQVTLRDYFSPPPNVKLAKPKQTTLSLERSETVIKKDAIRDPEPDVGQPERDEEGDIAMVDKPSSSLATNEKQMSIEEVAVDRERKREEDNMKGENKRKRSRLQDEGRRGEESDIEHGREKGVPAAKKRGTAKGKDNLRGNENEKKEVDTKISTNAAVTEAKKLEGVNMEKLKHNSEAEETSEDDVMPTKNRKRPLKAKTVLEDEVDDGAEASPKSEPPKREESSPKEDKKKVFRKASKAAEKKAKQEEEQETVNKLESEAEASGDEVEKPALSIAAQKEMQEALSKAKHPYKDWHSGTPTPYAAVCTSLTLIESTTKRLEKLEHLSLLLRQVLRLNPDELLTVVHILTNKLAADFEGIELGMGESTLIKAIAESCGRSVDKIKRDHREIGDLGEVAAASRRSQATLGLTKPKPLTVASVHEDLLRIATTKGEGTLQRKIDIIKKLLANAGKQGDEAKYIVRALEGKMRLGTADKTVLVGLSQAFVFWEKEKQDRAPSIQELQEGEETLKAVFSQCPSYEVIIPAMVAHGINKLKEAVKLQPGIPLKPMLAKASKSIADAIDNFGKNPFTMEYKYDGERTQIHYVSPSSNVEYAAPKIAVKKKNEKGLTRIFSRNSEDLSEKYPDILAVMNTWVKPNLDSFVLDCETVAWDTKEKKLLPFQKLMTRKKKDVALENVQVKVIVFAFDLLFLNGKSLVKEPLSERRRLMYESFNPVDEQFSFVTHKDTSSADDVDVIQSFLDESIKASCEGLMVKALTGIESVYEPSRRSQHWIKIKKDYLSGVGDSLDLVVLGAFHGKGKRTSVYGAFLLGCYNPSKQVYETICSIGTGFSEQMLEELHEKLIEHVIDRPKPDYSFSKTSERDMPDVWFEPAIVMEVKTADLTISPTYRAAIGLVDYGATDKGISLRFPRFLQIREDKKPEEATTSRQVAEMYRKQDVVSNGNGEKKNVDDDFEY